MKQKGGHVALEVLDSYSIQIWVGLRNGYSKHIFNLNDVRNICDEFVNNEKTCVSITQTEFHYVKDHMIDGYEPGVVIGLIQYPRFPRKKKKIRKQAINLAKILMNKLNQNRVSVVTPKKTYMLINDYK